MEKMYSERLPLVDERKLIIGPKIGILTEFGLIAVAMGSNCFLYTTTQKNAEDVVFQKLESLSLESPKRFASSLVYDKESNSAVAVLDSGEVFGWSLNEEGSITVSSVANQRVKFEEEVFDILSIEDSVVFVFSSGQLCYLSQPDKLVRFLQHKNEKITRVSISASYDDAQRLIGTHLVFAFERKDKNNVGHGFGVLLLHSKDALKYQLLYVNAVPEKVTHVCVSRRITENVDDQSQHRLVVTFENGRSDFFNLQTGIKVKSYPVCIKSNLDGNIFVCSAKNKTLFWLEPLNHVLGTLENTFETCESDSSMCALMSKDGDFVVYAKPIDDQMTLCSLVDSASKLSKGSLIPHSERRFDELCKIVMGKSEFESSIWKTIDRRSLIAVIRQLECAQVEKLFNLCASNFKPEEIDKRGFVLNLCEVILLSQRNTVIELLENNSAFREDFATVCTYVTDDCAAYDAMNDFLNTYDHLNATLTAKNNAVKWNKFSVTVLKI